MNPAIAGRQTQTILSMIWYVQYFLVVCIVEKRISSFMYSSP